MDKNVEFNRFKAEAMCRLCEIESCINYFAAGMLKRSSENGSDNPENIITDLYKYSEWLKETVPGYIDRSVENTILTLGIISDFTVDCKERTDTMSSAEMEKMIGRYLMFKIEAYCGFIDTVKLIFRSYPDKQKDIFNFVKYDAPHLTDTECLEKISKIVGFNE